MLYVLRAIYLGPYGFNLAMFIIGFLIGTFFSEESFAWWPTYLLVVALCPVLVAISNRGLAKLRRGLLWIWVLCQFLLLGVSCLVTSAFTLIITGSKQIDPWPIAVAEDQLLIRVASMMFGILMYPWILWVIDKLGKEVFD